MLVTKLEEAGFWPAMTGISLNKEQPVDNMPAVAAKLAKARDGSHRKFLRQMMVWLHITAPRFWWTEFDTYKVGTVRNSGSTMHNIHKRKFIEEDFEPSIPVQILNSLNKQWDCFKAGSISLRDLKASLPEGYLQQSVISLNYEVLRTIVADRANHRLPEWQDFIRQVKQQVQYPEFLGE